MKIFILLSLLLSCATSRTPYQSSKNGQGFSIKETKYWLESTFSANSRTRSDIASSYANLAAINHCHSKKKIAFISETLDRSKKTVYNSVTSSVQFVGNPYYNRFRRGSYYDHYHRHHFGYDNPYGLSLYVPLRTYYSSPRYIKYPVFTAKFICVDNYYNINATLELEEISKELVHTFTKDFRGGILIKKSNFLDLRVGDLVIQINEKRIDKKEDFYSLGFSDVKANRIQAKVLRDQKIINISLQATDITDKIQSTNKEIVQKSCSTIDPESKELPEICKS